MTPEEAAEARQAFRDAMPPMSDDDWELFCERMHARLSGEPHVHTRLCACGDDKGGETDVSAVGWAYWLNDHWHLCADEPTAHEQRQRVYLAENLDALKVEQDRLAREIRVQRSKVAWANRRIDAARDALGGETS